MRALRTTIMFLLGTLFAAAATSPALGSPPVDDKMKREIRRMERGLDEMLIDSPNFLVSGQDNARGYYVNGMGLLVTFDASLVSAGWNARNTGFFGNRSWWWDDDGEEDEDGRARRGTRSRRLAREEKQWNRGREELVEYLLDYGDRLKSASPGDWITVVAYLGDAEYFEDKEITHLVTKAKVDDLRLHAEGKISEDEARKRVVQEQY